MRIQIEDTKIAITTKTKNDKTFFFGTDDEGE